MFIFEGDVLKLANNELVVVSFKSGGFVGVRKNGTISLNSKYWVNSEVIGNIHQNTELLNP
jgi:hypothetical protein